MSWSMGDQHIGNSIGMGCHEERRRLLYAEPRALYHPLPHSLMRSLISITAEHMQDAFSRNECQPQRGQKILCLCVRVRVGVAVIGLQNYVPEVRAARYRVGSSLHFPLRALACRYPWRSALNATLGESASMWT